MNETLHGTLIVTILILIMSPVVDVRQRKSINQL